MEGYPWDGLYGMVAEVMKIGADEAVSVHWEEGRTRRLRVERSNNRIVTVFSETQGVERNKKVGSPAF